ncbi:HET-domain-containing protein [Apiospora phragmitis]|uniref:HET-domain-containing protein n=1 Tax=Apiospora phragmitis TaxID=2905665 RepID=A0ABR1WR30_9PEZI
MAYSYVSLDRSEQVIRLLYITPRKGSAAELHTYQLKHVSLDESPQFETISYCWGDPTPCRTVLIDGKELRLPRSSAAILEQISASSDQARVIWIDAVCVNQTDITERAHQVPLMARIYAQASRNIIYLGQGDAVCSKALEDIRALSREIDGLGADCDGELQTPIDKSALSAFFCLPWFRRVWVVQEVALARSSVCILGDGEIHFLEICQVVFSLFFRFSVISFVAKFDGIIGATVVLMMRGLRFRIASGLPPDLNNVFLISMMTQCTDLRDNVFGVLGLCHDGTAGAGTSSLIAVDYTKPYQQVFRDAARHAIMTTRMTQSDDARLACITRWISHHSMAELHDSTLPSWVPRFDRKMDTDQDGHALVVFCDDEEVAEEQSWSRDLGDPNVLELRGHVLGKVVQISPVFEPDMFSGDLAQLGCQLRTIQSMAPAGRYDHQLGRVLIADTTYQTQPSTPEDWEGLQSMLDCLVKSPGRLTNSLSDDVVADCSINGYGDADVLYYRELVQSCRTRRFIVTDRGDLGLAPRTCQIGDTAAALLVDYGGTPYILHPNEEDGTFKLVGHAYLDGYMPGRKDEAVSKGNINYDWLKMT